jgi:hypothetical protein
MLLRTGILIGFLVNNNTPLPLFLVSVASKELSVSLSSLFATHTRVPGSVAPKGLTLHQNGAGKAASIFGDAAKSARGRPIGVADVQSMQKYSMPALTVNKYYVLDIIRMISQLEVEDSRGDSG